MPTEITMPQQSDTMTEGTLVKWLKKEGDKVKANEIIAEIETDKATMEMEAFEGGTLAAILVKEGEKAAVGSAIAVLATAKEDPAQVKQQYASGAPASSKSAIRNPQSAIGSSTKSGATATIESPNTAELKESADIGHHATREPAHPVPPLPHAGNGDDDRVFATPVARRVAAEMKINLAQVKGTGPGGRITQQDVLNFQPSAAPQPVAQSALRTPQSEILPARITSGQTEKIQFTKMRAAIAAALQRSKQNVPHFYETIDIDVEELTKLRERMNAKLEKEKIRLSIGDFVTRAVAAALKRHPILNATFDAAKNEITRYGDVNLGVAVALPDGLIVPVLRGVDQMGLKEIRQRSVDLVDRARAQKLKQDEMKGATFTVSNLGAYGIREFMAIVNPPEVGILAVGAAEKRAVVKNDQVVARTMMTLTLSADHRVVDGATAAEFLRTLKEMLEEPALQLL